MSRGGVSWLPTLVEVLLIELLVDADGHTKDTRLGMASIRRPIVLEPDAAGIWRPVVATGAAS